MRPIKEEIALAIERRLSELTEDNGYSLSIKKVNYKRAKMSGREYRMGETPVVQIVDVYKRFNHQYSRSNSVWNVALDLILRPDKENGFDQTHLWKFEEEVREVLFKEAKLGIPKLVSELKVIDEVGSLTVNEPILASTLGLQVIYYETLRKQDV